MNEQYLTIIDALKNNDTSQLENMISKYVSIYQKLEKIICNYLQKILICEKFDIFKVFLEYTVNNGVISKNIASKTLIRIIKNHEITDAAFEYLVDEYIDVTNPDLISTICCSGSVYRVNYLVNRGASIYYVVTDHIHHNIIMTCDAFYDGIISNNINMIETIINFGFDIKKKYCKYIRYCLSHNKHDIIKFITSNYEEYNYMLDYYDRLIVEYICGNIDNFQILFKRTDEHHKDNIRILERVDIQNNVDLCKFILNNLNKHYTIHNIHQFPYKYQDLVDYYLLVNPDLNINVIIRIGIYSKNIDFIKKSLNRPNLLTDGRIYDFVIADLIRLDVPDLLDHIILELLDNIYQSNIKIICDAAIYKLNYRILNFILDNGYDVKRCIRQYVGARQYMTDKYDSVFELFNFLIDKGFDVNSTICMDMTAIELILSIYNYARKQYHFFNASHNEKQREDSIILQIIILFIENGFNLNSCKNNILASAIYGNLLETTKYLFEYNSDISTINSDLIINIINLGHTNMLKYIFDNGVIFDEEYLRRAIHIQYFKIIEYFLQLDIRVSKKTLKLVQKLMNY